MSVSGSFLNTKCIHTIDHAKKKYLLLAQEGVPEYDDMISSHEGIHTRHPDTHSLFFHSSDNQQKGWWS